ncbi:hypothetical protein MAC_05514 [Metarhizium acridum CQMa 102]|uniref:Uncharacterized protein n=1 Tax=Metarhizium acridum (strain CQMa 102) TaxID=655827 RepID=E9E6L6_METAQ|nr:uncharacterized protein MAC_05514 [Metarhizium acridum CQMa 102]EFY88462.1 hypothetical protein MAC_05514 [Metarhizium acridum CQMa 102]
MRDLVRKALTLGSLAATTAAVTPIPDADMDYLLNTAGIELAMKAQPMFLMGQAVGKAPCIPSWAIVNGTQAAPSELCAWPDSGCHCRNPGVPLGSPMPSFPVYFSYSRGDEKKGRVVLLTPAKRYAYIKHYITMNRDVLAYTWVAVEYIPPRTATSS